ncbi:TetR/AcrR family transcriptional regulator [Methanobacterium sp. ACI-7]|uniref:TetR/AcrR family transcriptional regulator n=1 Tax=unclassified Methanobacterium TaxID=2627676 RepID=UPI0039C10CBE
MPKVVPEYKEIAKKKIIKAAVNIFSNKGFHKSTMDEIAGEVGVSKATLYTYFKNKEAILKEIWELSSENILDLKKTYNNYDCFEVLEELYYMIAKSPGLHLSFEITALSPHNKNIKKINNESYEAKLESLKLFLEDQQEKTNIRDDIEAEVLAQIITALYTDVTTQLLIGINNEVVHEKWIKSVKAVLEK